jgi:hypothetical protein
MRTVLGSILRAAGNSGNVCLGPSLRNHGLITGWRILGVLSNRMETIVCPSVLGFLVSTVSRKRSNQTELRAYTRTVLVSILRAAGNSGNVWTAPNANPGQYTRPLAQENPTGGKPATDPPLAARSQFCRLEFIRNQRQFGTQATRRSPRIQALFSGLTSGFVSGLASSLAS